ncbi:hypothetical protein [Kitasatospora sp. NPDC094011]|uniref:hypothetical protein n=1 Tax=Kitasatospora sp. NPDC094011 TaxID=3364090 RepID=UPI0038253681
MAVALTLSAAATTACSASGPSGLGFSCGLWAQLSPLAVGDHTLRIRGQAGDLGIAVDYLLHVPTPGPA